MFFVKQQKNHFLLKVFLSYFAFFIVIASILFALSRLDQSSLLNEKEILEKAIYKNVVHCYAINGVYPSSIEYMENHYGLSYDHNKYIINYELYGGNIMPNIIIIER